jgi:hypothetical protein
MWRLFVLRCPEAVRNLTCWKLRVIARENNLLRVDAAFRVEKSTKTRRAVRLGLKCRHGSATEISVYEGEINYQRWRCCSTRGTGQT